ncbi:MAG TPA: hypothetical protein VNZ52_11590 [Candidatus Thermoplasmatota archaeon]|nr:hypothetical protein [Candidatus Thermoplasmatota archaeon]
MSEVLLSAKTLIGAGEGSLIVEPRANAIRIKGRAGELYVRTENAEELGRALLAAAANARRVRA